MSYDFRMLRPCSHRINEELVELSLDRRTIDLPRFVADKNRLELLVNGRTRVPRTGLYSRARIVASGSGPFVIDDTNDLFSVRADGGSRQTALVPHGLLTSDNVSRSLTSQLLGVRTSVSRSRLVIESSTSGPASQVFLEPEKDDDTGADVSTVNSTLGLRNRYGVRGLEVFPAWTVEASPGTVPPRQPSRIRFARPLRTSSNFWEVTYHTTVESCPRCHGIGVEYDYVGDSDGSPEIVEDEELLIQAVEKIVLTVLGSDPFATWYGTYLLSLVGSKSVSFVQREVSRQVSSAMSTLQNLQVQQQRVQKVSDREFLARVDAVNVRQSSSSQTVFFVDVAFTTRAGTSQTVSQVVDLRGASRFLGTDAAARQVDAYLVQKSGFTRRA